MTTQENLNLRAAESRLPLRHWKAQVNFCDSVFVRAMDAIKVAPPGSIMVVVGPRGNGKTQLAVEIGRWLLETDKSVHYTTPVNLALRFRSARRWKSEESEEDVFDSLASVTGLIVDEIGQDVGNSDDAALFFRLIDHRYANLKRTLLIGNFLATSVSQVLGSSIVSRAHECGGILDTSTWPPRR